MHVLPALQSMHALKSLCTKFGESGFSHAGLTAWTCVPRDVKDALSLNIFGHKLKTHLFSLYAYF